MPLGIFGGAGNGPKPQPLPNEEKSKKDKSAGSNSHNDAKGTTIKLGKKSYTVEKRLAEGGFAIVYLVADKRSRNYALKRQLIRDDPRQVEACRTEIQIVKNLSGHKNIVAYVDHQLTVNKAGVYDYMLLTVYYQTNVLQLINSRLLSNRSLSSVEILDIFCDVCEAVARLHHSKTPVVHRDLKVENVLIDKRTGSERPVYVLCDYGSATTKNFNRENFSQNFIEEEVQRYTTLGYRAPEMIDLFSRVPIDTKSDIWALGVLLFKLCYFSLPFGESALAIQSGLFTFPETPKDITSEVKAIINLCMTQSARHRPNIYQISYLAFSASGRKCPVYNIEKSSRIEVPEAVQILQLREKIGTNYARAFERAIDEFEEQKQRRDAQGRAQLIAAKLLGSPFPNQKNTEQANGMDSRRDNVGRSENTTVSMTSQNQHFHGPCVNQKSTLTPHRFSVDSNIQEGLIVATDFSAENERNRLTTGSTSVNPRLRPKPTTTTVTPTTSSVLPSALASPNATTPSPNSSQQPSHSRTPVLPHQYRSPRLGTLALAASSQYQKQTQKADSTNKETVIRNDSNPTVAPTTTNPMTISVSNLTPRNDADIPKEKSPCAQTQQPAESGPSSPHVSDIPSDSDFVDFAASRTSGKIISQKQPTSEDNNGAGENGLRSSAFRPYTIVTKQQRQEAVDILGSKKLHTFEGHDVAGPSHTAAPKNFFNNPFVTGPSDDERTFGQCFDELARRKHKRSHSTVVTSASLAESYRTVKTSTNFGSPGHQRNASVAGGVPVKVVSGTVLPNLGMSSSATATSFESYSNSKALPAAFTSTTLFSNQFYGSGQKESLSLRLARRAAEIAGESYQQKGKSATDEEFWRCVPLSYQHQHQSSRPDGKCLFTVEEFERVFNEDPFVNIPFQRRQHLDPSSMHIRKTRPVSWFRNQK